MKFALLVSAALASLTAPSAFASTTVMTCETLEVFIGSEKQVVPGSIVVTQNDEGKFEVSMTSNGKTQTSAGVEITDGEAKDLDLASISDALAVVAPEVDATKIAKATAAMIAPVNEGDSNLLIIDLKDAESKSLVKVLNFGNGAAIGRCSK
jgi:hypothetical protein